MHCVRQGGRSESKTTQLRESAVARGVVSEMKRPLHFAGHELLETIGSELRHRNIPRVYEIGEWEGQRFVTMDLERGLGLGMVVADGGHHDSSY